MKLTPKAELILMELQQHGNSVPSPSADPLNKGHYRTYLQELGRALAGEQSSTPDELLPRKTKKCDDESQLFPAHTHCPHIGCWKFGFRTVADSKVHEMLMHPGERAQRLADCRRRKQQKSLIARLHFCDACGSSFSSRTYLGKHRKSYDHMSVAIETI